MKKFLTILTSVAFLCGSVATPSFATTTYDDFVSPTKAANLIPSASAAGGKTYFSKLTGEVGERNYGTTVDSKSTFEMYYPTKTTTDALKISTAFKTFAGFWLNGSGAAINYTPEGGKTYVFSANLKNTSSSGVTPYFGMQTNNGTTASSIVYSNEYGSTGMAVGDDWTPFAASITLPSDYVTAKKFALYNAFVLGFPSGTKAGAACAIDVSNDDAVYFAEEQLYDVSVTTTDKTTIRNKGTISANAKVLNQVGTVGSLPQNFDWIVLDSNRSEVSGGFTLTKNNEKVTLTATALATGTYYLYAKSTDYDNCGKGLAFTLTDKAEATPTPTATPTTKPTPTPTVKPTATPTATPTAKPTPIVYKDYEPESLFDNLIPNATDGGGYTYFGARSSEVDGSNWYNTDEGFQTFDYTYPSDASETADLTIADVWRNFSGFWLNQNKGDGKGAFGFVAEDGASYVFSIRVKDVSTIDNSDPHVGIQMNNSFGGSTAILSSTYGKNGMKVERDWTEFKDTITLPSNYVESASNGEYANKFIFGMTPGQKVGTSLRFDCSSNDAIYLAKAKVYNITASVDNQVPNRNNKIKITSALVNQIGGTSGINQSFKYVVFNSDGEDVTSTLEPSESGATLTLTIGDNTPLGEYTAYAISTEYPSMMRSVKFTVTIDDAYIQNIITRANNNEDLTKSLGDYLDALGIRGDLAKVDYATLASLIQERSKTVTFTTENIVSEFKQLSVLGLYNKNDAGVALCDESGDFIYSSELSLDSFYATNTLKTVWSDITDATVHKTIQTALQGKAFKTIDDFYKLYAQSLILNALKTPKVYGSAYVASILTLANATAGGISIEKYLSLKSKTAANNTLARNVYTVESLEKAISNLKESTSGESGGGGGGGGSSSSGNSADPSTVTTPVSVPTNMEVNFADIDEDYWAYDQIYHLKKLGIVSGSDNNLFYPEDNITREEFVKMLVGALDYTLSSSASKFNDVSDAEWYAPYIATAVEKGIVNGVGDNEFGVGEPITRQDLCVISARAAAITSLDDLTFTDYNDIADYATEAVSGLYNYGVISGFPDGSFQPNATCTRSQAAKILCEILNLSK